MTPSPSSRGGAARPAPSRSAPARVTGRARRSRNVSPGAIESLLERQPWEVLRAPLSNTGVDVAAAIEALRRYAQRLVEWNRTASNLVSHNDEKRLVERHILESVLPARWLIDSKCQNWVDFGSGAGLPAIPLAIAGVSGRWTLVEARRTKTLFIRKMADYLLLSNIATVNDRLENFVQETGRARAFDGFTSRATLRLAPTLALAARIIGPGGSAFLWKGSSREQEMAADAAWRHDWDLAGELGVGGGPNAVVRFVRK